MKYKAALWMSRGFVGILAVSWCLRFAAAQQAATQPTAQEVLEKSQAAMAPPIRYRIRTNGVDMLVSQKMLSDGSLVSRTETSLPTAKVGLLLGEESYELYPDHGVAINTNFLYEKMMSQASALSAALGGAATQSVKMKGIVLRQGADCFAIETTFPPKVTALLAKTLSDEARKKLPRGNRLYIDKDTYLLVEMETISQTGAVILKMAIKDVTQDADLADDLFLPPNGIDMETPKSMAEYVALVGSMLTAQRPRIRPPAPSVQPPRLNRRARSGPMGRVTVDPKTGRAIAPLPPGMTRAEFDRRLAEKRAALRSASKAGPAPIGMSTPRKIGILVSCFMILALVAIIARQAARKSSSAR
jgi:hypothetical protein